MNVEIGRQNIIIMNWITRQFHFWEYINRNHGFKMDSHRPFICSVCRCSATSVGLGYLEVGWIGKYFPCAVINLCPHFEVDIKRLLCRATDVWGMVPHCKNKMLKIWNKYSQKRNIGVSVQISTFMCLWANYILPRWVCLFCGRKYVDRSWEYINRSQTHESGNWGWGRAIARKGIYKRDCRCSAKGGKWHPLLTLTRNNTYQASILRDRWNSKYTVHQRVLNDL